MFLQEVTVIDSGSPIPESLFNTNAEYFVTNRIPVYKGHTSLSNVGNQTKLFDYLSEK